MEVLHIVPASMLQLGAAQLLPLLTPLQPLLAPKLHSLTLRFCDLVQCPAIARLTQVKILRLPHCSSLAVANLMELSTLSGLRTLDIDSLESLRSSRKNMECFANGLVQLRELVLRFDRRGIAAARDAFKERVVEFDERSLTLRPLE